MSADRLVATLIACSLLWIGELRAQSGFEVAGKLAIQEKGGKRATDVSDAVIWLEGGGVARATRVEIGTEKKQFVPRVVVVGAGSTVAFPNHDPFDHNVFSVSEEGAFDLGWYGRGETRTASFPKAGVIRVYCNHHAQMSAFVVVRNTPFYTQPAADGSFRMTGVPPGTYLLKAWHERGGETSQMLTVSSGAVSGVAVALDASGFKFQAHLNKFGKPYESEGRRY